MADFPEYELAGIETIARGICIRGGKLLVCYAKNGDSCYLPGGHVEFGETGRQALVREIREEMGVESSTGAFRGVVENAFMQHGKPHAEINLVYELTPAEVTDRSQEDWIGFKWVPLADLSAAKLLPEAFRRLGTDPAAVFSV